MPWRCHSWCPATMRLHPGLHSSSGCIVGVWKQPRLESKCSTTRNRVPLKLGTKAEDTYLPPQPARQLLRPLVAAAGVAGQPKTKPREAHVQVSAPRCAISSKPRFRTSVSMYNERMRAVWQLVWTPDPGSGTGRRHLRGDPDRKFRKSSKLNL